MDMYELFGLAFVQNCQVMDRRKQKLVDNLCINVIILRQFLFSVFLL